MKAASQGRVCCSLPHGILSGQPQRMLSWGAAGLGQGRKGYTQDKKHSKYQGLPVLSSPSLALARGRQALGAGGRGREQRKSQK